MSEIVESVIYQKLWSLPKNKKFAFSVDDNRITENALKLVDKLVTDWLKENGPGGYYYGNRGTLSNFSREWVVEGKDAWGYSGTFPKRVSSFIRRNYGTSLPTEIKEQIGNLTRNSVIGKVDIHWVLSNRFDWRPGDFSDRSSCYWGSNSYARYTLEDNGCRTIKVFDHLGRGSGRGIIFPIIFKGADKQKLKIPVIYNITGPSEQVYLALLKSQLDSEIVSKTINVKYDYVLYTNGGYVRTLAEPELDKQINSKLTPSFGLKITNMDDSTCVKCKTYLDYNEIFRDDEGNHLCYSCFSKEIVYV